MTRLFLLTAVALATAAGQTPSFQARSDFYTYFTAQPVIGDFNGDGLPDFINGNTMLSNGDGTFTSVPSLGGGPVSAAGDVNNDGKLDLVSGGPSGQIELQLGNGDGTFQPATTIFTTSPLRSINGIAVGDLNGDGFPDIVAATESGVDILLNQGNGTFLPTTSHLVGYICQSIAIIQGEPYPGLAVGVTPGLVILAGTGTGSFTGSQSFTLPYVVGTIALGDLNGDGQQDLATSGNQYIISPEVNLFYGNGLGQFDPPKSIATTIHTAGVAIGDVNGDGMQDLVLIDSQLANIVVLLNEGASFGSPKSFTSSYYTIFLALGAFREPGLLDIVTTGWLADDSPVLLNQGNGTYTVCPHVPLPYEPGAMASTDFNKDGRGDIVAATPTGLSVFLGTGNSAGPFTAGQTIATPALVYSIATGDFNNDGNQDFAVSLANNEIEVFLGNGTGTFGQPFITQAGSSINPIPLKIVAADFNGDGKLDLADDFNQIFPGNGNGTFGAPTTIYTGVTFILQIATTDLNRDGKPDIVLVGYGVGLAKLICLTNQGGGVFKAQKLDNGYTYDISPAIATGDLNGDGYPDILLVEPEYAGQIFLSNGAGGFTGPTSLPFDVFYSTNAVIADVNGDGKNDIAMGTGLDSNVALFTGNGDGTFQYPLFFGTAPGADFVVYGRYRGQSSTAKPDLAIAAADGIDVLINTTP